jgi:pyruvate/2-oxoglutarate dehydrogenase complex dihydrolipoamide acyltransferase (E2) component
MTNHVKLKGTKDYSNWRKSSIHNWSIKNDSSTYVMHDLDISNLVNFSNSKKLNPFICFIKIVSMALKDTPEANVILKGNKVFYRDTQNIFIHVIEDDAFNELSGYVVYDSHRKSYEEVNTETNEALKKIKNGESFFKSSLLLVRYIPNFLFPLVYKLSGLLLYRFNINLFPSLIPTDCFGSIMISNIGSIGLEKAFIPLVSHSGAHLAMSYGKSFNKLVKIDDKIQERPYVSLGFTFDHRAMDGYHLNLLIKKIENIILSL